MKKRFDKDSAFEKVRRRIYQLAAEVAKARNMPFDDCVSAAMLGCAQAFATYDRSTKIVTWVTWKVNSSLMDEVRRFFRDKAKDKKRIPMELFDAEQKEFPEWEEEHDWITDDVHAVLVKIMLPTGRVLRAIKAEAKPELIRNIVKKQLRKEGWPDMKIRKTFVTIKRNLGG